MSQDKEVLYYKPTALDDTFVEGLISDLDEVYSADEREKPSTDSAQAEAGFTPAGAIGKTVGLSYRTEANL